MTSFSFLFLEIYCGENNLGMKIKLIKTISDDKVMVMKKNQDEQIIVKKNILIKNFVMIKLY